MANRLIITLPLLAAVALAVGCQDTTQPTFNPFAPLGPSTVPPPATGSFGAPRTGQAQPYYTPNAQANGITAPTGGLRTGAAPSLSTPPQASVTNASGIRQIGFNDVVGTGVNTTIATMPTMNANSSANGGGGMHVNDATLLAPQPLYQPPQQVPAPNLMPTGNPQSPYGFQVAQPASAALPPSPSQPAFIPTPGVGSANNGATNGLTQLSPNEVVPLLPIPRNAFPQQPVVPGSANSVNSQFMSPVGNGWGSPN